MRTKAPRTVRRPGLLEAESLLDRERFRLLRGVLIAALAGVGAVLLAFASLQLRSAHLYRQRTGEGLLLFGVGVVQLLGGGLVGIAVLLLVGWRKRLYGPSRTLAAVVAWALSSGVAACFAVAMWVENHGDRCIGPCG